MVRVSSDSLLFQKGIIHVTTNKQYTLFNKWLCSLSVGAIGFVLCASKVRSLMSVSESFTVFVYKRAIFLSGMKQIALTSNNIFI